MTTTWLEIQRTTGIDKRRVRPAGAVGVAQGACPGCGCEPFEIKGDGQRRVDDRLVKAGGYCVACGDAVGWIYHRPDTLFGLEEDERVLSGRARVYG